MPSWPGTARIRSETNWGRFTGGLRCRTRGLRGRTAGFCVATRRLRDCTRGCGDLSARFAHTILFMPDAITLRQADSLYQGFPDFSAWPAPTEDDLRLWDRFASRLEETRQKATPETLKKALDVAVRAAALDTGAIEGLYSVDRGFTMTVATQALAWEHALEEKGDNVRALFEAQLEAYELVLDAVTRSLPISEAWIRALHEKVCAGQEKYRDLTDQGWQEQVLPRGTYKTQPNHVRL